MIPASRAATMIRFVRAFEYARLLAFASGVKSAYFFAAILLTSSNYSTTIIQATVYSSKQLRLGIFLQCVKDLPKRLHKVRKGDCRREHTTAVHDC